ncbi:MAG: hypothetical protein M1309_01665 [Actinobacteria bacterium]|nr:hypothetical protein [Actinomycetota bacterium]
MTEIICPYCGSSIITSFPEKFQPCASCGYSSAQIESSSGNYLIIDSQLPDLMKVYDHLSRKMGRMILIDRRVSYRDVAGADRRS